RPLGDILGLSGELLATIVASVAFLCCACGVAVVVCVYRRNRALQHTAPPPQTQPAYPMEVSGNYGTNGTFGTMLVEKPPPYPGAPQHTSVIPPGENRISFLLFIGNNMQFREVVTARVNCLSPATRWAAARAIFTPYLKKTLVLPPSFITTIYN
ncbi:hypothetical protein SK128_028601, partial [Halocaridina rubra]